MSLHNLPIVRWFKWQIHLPIVNFKLESPLHFFSCDSWTTREDYVIQEIIKTLLEKIGVNPALHQVCFEYSHLVGGWYRRSGLNVGVRPPQP